MFEALIAYFYYYSQAVYSAVVSGRPTYLDAGLS